MSPAVCVLRVFPPAAVALTGSLEDFSLAVDRAETERLRAAARNRPAETERLGAARTAVEHAS